MSSSTFEGKVAVVTGAASGFGRGIAEHFAREGACVVLVDRNAEGLEVFGLLGLVIGPTIVAAAMGVFRVYAQHRDMQGAASA